MIAGKHRDRDPEEFADAWTSTSRRNNDVAPDGRFLFVRRTGDAQNGSMVVVEHFVDEVRRAVKDDRDPTSRRLDRW